METRKTKWWYLTHWKIKAKHWAIKSLTHLNYFERLLCWWMLKSYITSTISIRSSCNIQNSVLLQQQFTGDLNVREHEMCWENWINCPFLISLYLYGIRRKCCKLNVGISKAFDIAVKSTPYKKPQPHSHFYIVYKGNLRATLDIVQSSHVITRCNVLWYFLHHENYNSAYQLWSHKLYHISRPCGQAMSCRMWGFGENWPCYTKTRQ